MFDFDADYQHAQQYDLPAAIDRYEALYAKSHGDLIETARHAWRGRSVVDAIAAGEVLRRHGRLGGKEEIRFVTALMADGRHEQAAQVAAEICARSPAFAWAWRSRAEALAVLGALEDSAAAVQTAANLDPGHAEFLVQLETLIAARDAMAATPSWSAARRFVELCLELDAERPAATALRELLSAPPEPAADSLEDSVVLGRAALRVLDVGEAAPFIAALREQFPDSLAVSVLDVESQTRSGTAAEAVHTYRKRERALKRKHRDMRYALANARAAAGDLDGAIERLGDLTVELSKEPRVGRSLTRIVGQKVLQGLDIRFAPQEPRRRVFNVVPFNNEFVMLKMRLTEMDWVDQFVIVESAQTFTGQPKPFYYEAFKAELGALADKVLHVRLETYPDSIKTAWARDYYQRDMGVSALSGLWSPDDLVLLSDADEIVDRAAIERFDYAVASLKMSTHKFFFNYCATDERRAGALCKARLLGEFGSSYVRFSLCVGKKGWNYVPDGGWHFTSINDAALIASKFSAYAHREARRAGWDDAARVESVLNQIKAGHAEPGWEFRPIDERFPAYVREHQDELAPFIVS